MHFRYIVVFTVLGAFSQQSRFISIPDLGDKEYPKAVTEGDDGSFLVGGSLFDGLGLLMKLTEDGEATWVKEINAYRDDTSIQGFVQGNVNGGNSFVGIGGTSTYDYPVIFEVDKTTGNPNWCSVLDEDFAFFRSIIAVDDGYIGLFSDSGILIVKFDLSGGFVWGHKLTVDGMFYFCDAYDIQQTSDGGLIIVGWTSESITTYAVLLIKTDASGNKEWAKKYGNNDYRGYSVQQTSDGGYIVTGSGDEGLLLMKTTITGARSWFYCYSGVYGNHGNSVIEQSDGSGYVVTGEWDDMMCIIKFSTSGNPDSWYYRVGVEGSPELASGEQVIESSDGGLLAVGYSGANGMITKLDRGEMCCDPCEWVGSFTPPPSDTKVVKNFNAEDSVVEWNAWTADGIIDCLPTWTSQDISVSSSFTRECFDDMCDLGEQCEHGGVPNEECTLCEDCDGQWEGTLCDECGLECEHNGVCNVGGTACEECDIPWTGTLCDSCVLVGSCQHGGTVNAECSSCENCDDSWIGTYCEECATDCLNGGVCKSMGIECDCLGGWEGDDCSISQCSEEEWCQNGGICNGVDSCDCPDGFSGPRCNTTSSTTNDDEDEDDSEDGSDSGGESSSAFGAGEVVGITVGLLVMAGFGILCFCCFVAICCICLFVVLTFGCGVSGSGVGGTGIFVGRALKQKSNLPDINNNDVMLEDIPEEGIKKPIPAIGGARVTQKVRRASKIISDRVRKGSIHRIVERSKTKELKGKKVGTQGLLGDENSNQTLERKNRPTGPPLRFNNIRPPGPSIRNNNQLVSSSSPVAGHHGRRNNRQQVVGGVRDFRRKKPPPVVRRRGNLPKPSQNVVRTNMKTRPPPVVPRRNYKK